MSRAFTTGSLPRAYDLNGDGTRNELGIGNATLSSDWAQTQIDFRADDTNTDYSFRFARGNTGANAPSYIQNKGTGGLLLYAVDAGSVQLWTANTATAIAHSGGQFATYKQPFFTAQYSGLTVPTNTTDIRFDTVVYNIGNHYNSTTGVFTAPVAGDYLLFVRMLFVNATAGRTDLAFHRNAALLPGVRVVIQKPANTWYSLHGTFVVSLAANDAISVRPTIFGPALYTDINFNCFGGYFLG
jgi:hypothetical protein